MEGECYWQEYGEWQDIFRETVHIQRALNVDTNLPRYNSAMELEDAVHTAILTLKEGFEGGMTETSLEIGIAQGDEVEVNDTSLASGKRVVKRGVFRKLSVQEIKDYLANLS